MAIYDQRVFVDGHEQWWVAEVHAASGLGVGDMSSPMTKESVIFTSITDRDEPSRWGRVPAGWLNLITHCRLLNVMCRATKMESRMEMTPHNSPDIDEYSAAAQYRDEEGLVWAIRTLSVGAPEDIHGWRPDIIFQVVCLGDSALRRDVLVDSGASTASGLMQSLENDPGPIVRVVKSSFREWPEADYDLDA